MAFTITTYNFTKRSNSTLLPTNETGQDLSVVLKDKTSYDRPVFLLQSDDLITFNYVKWGSWYYFVTDISFVRNDLYEVSCDLDVLATFKTEIGNTTAFILYDTAANTEIVDSRISQKTSVVCSFNTYNHPFFVNYGQGGHSDNFTVIAGIIGEDGSDMWAISKSDVADLFDGFDGTLYNLLDPTQTLEELLSAGFQQIIGSGNARECVKSALALPMAQEFFSGNSGTIYLGTFETDVTGIKLNKGLASCPMFPVDIPITWPVSDWRRNDSYLNYNLTLPYCGTVQLSTSDLIGASQLSVLCGVSLNGTAYYYVLANNGKQIGTYYGNCAMPFLIGSSQITPSQAIGGMAAGAAGLVGAAASIALGSPLGALASGAAGIRGVINGATPTQSMVGGGGGGIDYGKIILCSTFRDTNVAPDSVSAAIGTPSMAVKQINTLSGYVQTSCASVAVAAEDPIRTKINALLDGGIFYE